MRMSSFRAEGFRFGLKVLVDSSSFRGSARSVVMKSVLNQVVSSPIGAFLVLVVAASLEVLGDSFFQSGLYRSGGVHRGMWFVAGVAVLGVYGWSVNLPQWDFGKLLGAYVALFFVVAQVVAKVRFHQSPTVPIWVGGSLIVAGGLVITFWKG
jgi:small multidrug resistance family-3 protein